MSSTYINITRFSAFHLGRKLKLQQFRDGKELPWFAYDDFYDFNYQQNRPLREEKKIMPGDSLVMSM